MKQDHDKERIKDEERCDYQSDIPPPFDQFDYDTAQPIPDIPDWRELCREMQEKGVVFEAACGDGSWKSSRPYFFPDYMHKKDYRIPQQSIPKWSNEEMTEETKPDPRDEIPHRELQIQWHEDCLHHLRTGEPMPVWEYRLKNGDGEWKICHDPHFSEKYEYLRKPRTVTYWHCVVEYADSKTGCVISEVLQSAYCKEEAESDIARYKAKYQTAKFSPITETTVEMED